MLPVIARILTYLSPLWLSYHLYWLQHGYREQVLDQFIRSPEPDYAVGAALMFAQTFSVPVLAVVACGVLWKKAKNKGTRTLGIAASATLLLGAALYFTLPSLEDDTARRFRELMKQANGVRF